MTVHRERSVTVHREPSVKREKKPTRCNNQMIIINFCLNMFRESLCPSSGGQRTRYCIWCIVLVLLNVVGSGCGNLSWRMWALVHTSYKTAPYNCYQPHPAEPEQYTKCSNRAFVLLKMGIMMPETCWDKVNNKHLIVVSWWFFSLHTCIQSSFLVFLSSYVYTVFFPWTLFRVYRFFFKH